MPTDSEPRVPDALEEVAATYDRVMTDIAGTTVPAEEVFAGIRIRHESLTAQARKTEAPGYGDANGS